jgi:hypothetical protein
MKFSEILADVKEKIHTQLPLTDLFHQSVYSRMLGYVVLDMDSTEIPVHGQQEEFRTLTRCERRNGL